MWGLPLYGVAPAPIDEKSNKLDNYKKNKRGAIMYLPLILLAIFIIACLLIIAYFESKNYKKFRQNLVDELREENQNTSLNMCKNCYYKKRCEELENGQK